MSVDASPKIEEPQIPYSVTPLFNDHQIDKTKGYFDLLVKAGRKEKIAIKLLNHSAKNVKIRITPHTAKTSANGTIDYSGMALKNTENLVASFEKITSSEQLVVIPPRKSQEVSFTIDVPKQAFEGILLGGFYIQEEQDSDQQQGGQESNVAIKNEFSFIIGCQLRMGTNQQVPKKFAINDVHLDTYGGYFSVVTEIANIAPTLVSNFLLKGEIINETGQSIYTFKKEPFSMAPNSVYSLPEAVKKDLLKPGSYKIKGHITSQNKQKKWLVTKSFTVTAKERNAVMKESLEEQTSDRLFLAIAVGIIVGLLVCLLVILIKKKK